MKKIIFYLFVLICNESYSQVCNTSFFENYNEDWSSCIYEKELVDEQITMYRVQQILSSNNSIYSIYTIDAWDGFVINKVNESTGEQIWSKYYFQSQDSVRYFPTSISLIENSTLLLYCIAESKTRNSGTIWYHGNLSKWKFNSFDGSLISNQTTDDLDTNNINMDHPFNIIANHIFSSHLFLQNNSNKYVKKYAQNGIPILISHIVNDQGHSISDTIIQLPIKFDKIIFHQSKRILNNRLFSLRYSLSSESPSDSFQIKFDIFDENWKNIASKDITSFFDGDSYRESFVGDSTFCVLEKKRRLFLGDTLQYYSVYSFTQNGELLEKIRLVRPDGSPIKPFRGKINVRTINSKTLILVQTIDNLESYWEWFLSTGNGGIERVGKLKLINNEDRFLWDIFSQVNMQLLNNGNILVHAIHESNTGTNLTETKIPYLFSFSLDKLRETVSVFNNDIPSIKIYPNPVNYTINVKGLIDITEFKIRNMQGRILLSGKLNNEILVQDLSAGVYILELYGESDIYTKKFIKI